MRRTKGALTAVVLLLAHLTPDGHAGALIPDSQDAPAVRVMSHSQSLSQETGQRGLALAERITFLLQASKADDSERTHEILNDFVSPNELAWLDNLFLPTPCFDIHANYKGGITEFLQTTPERLREAIASFKGDLDEIGVAVRPIEPPFSDILGQKSILDMLQKPTPLFQVHLDTATDRFTHAGHPILWLGVFAYVDGGFRYLPYQVLQAFPSAETSLSVYVGDRALNSVTFLSTPNPVYPREVLGQCIQATVRLEGVVTTDGAVDELRVLEGEGVFAHAALETVGKWRLEPLRVKRKRVRARITVEVEFIPWGETRK